MNNLRKEIDMGFTKDRFPEGTHLCLIYDDDEQRKKIIGQFLAKGISIGEQVGYYADTTTPKEIKNWLEDMGILDEKRGGILCVQSARRLLSLREICSL
ncbi:MAG: MEDS domain-containing protein [Candidatus Methanoperedens sp.]|nr:MEDS domain-containing protein [Candidatus Methanoperedens sp.]